MAVKKRKSSARKPTTRRAAPARKQVKRKLAKSGNWFKSMTAAAQRQYVKDHPNSIYARGKKAAKSTMRSAVKTTKVKMSAKKTAAPRKPRTPAAVAPPKPQPSKGVDLQKIHRLLRTARGVGASRLRRARRAGK